jgi:hypothetical protein
MKNVKSVKQSNGKRLKIQKRLLLVNIDELHRNYKKKLNADGLKVFGLSIFATLRPAHVITVGSSGTHSGYQFSSLGPEFDSQVSAVAPTPGHVPPHIQFTRLFLANKKHNEYTLMMVLFHPLRTHYHTTTFIHHSLISQYKQKY